MIQFHVDLCSYDDYDKAVAFLLKNGVRIISRDKMKMTVIVETTRELLDRMLDECDFEEVVLIGDSPLE